jgi:hypothetical protein
MLAMLATPVAAQLKPEKETGSRIPVQPQSVDHKAAGVIRKGFAQCVYDRARAKALVFLQHTDAETIDLAGARITDIKNDLRLSDCLGEQVRYNELALGLTIKPPALRDMLAEEAYLAVNRTAPAVPANAQPVDTSFISTGEALDQAKAVSAFIDCAIRVDLPHADALLRTMPGSDNERDAAGALAPTLGACLFRGQNFVLTPASIRSFIAFGMWNRFARGTAK